MSVIDEFFDKIEPEKRAELERLRGIVRAMLPEADETISYGMPTMKYHHKPVLGFNALKDHVGIYPFSGHVISGYQN